MINQKGHIIPIVTFKFKNTMLKSSLCAYGDAYILVCMEE